ncbi:DoxX family protein [Mucilaginibacter sp. PAMB04168]|uniref:DoxX family protein n=1 Tax=Mucilaginibacter sp. PAMB04168 TaxID=3138567 RepID=UPI0031F6B9B1
MLKKISLVILVIGYIAAGINHFVHPDGYLKIIPDYLPYPNQLNYISGGFEIFFGLLLVLPTTRNYGVSGLIMMLALFMPVHITMLHQAPVWVGSLFITPLLAWLRLFLQPVLMLWLFWHMQTKRKPVA